MHFVERLSIKEIDRRTGRDRNTIRRALASAEPPRYGAAAEAPLEARSLQGGDRAPARRRSDALRHADPRADRELGYAGGKTILDDYLREVRPRFCRRRAPTSARVYRPGELCQFDLWEPRARDPGRPRPDAPRLGRDRRAAATRGPAPARWSSPSRAPTSLWGMSRCLRALGAPAGDAGLGPRGRDPRRRRAPDRGLRRLLRPARGWAGSSSRPATPESKGVLERRHGFLHAQLRGRGGASPTRSTSRPSSTPGSSGPTPASTARSAPSPAERLAEERERMRPLPERMPDLDRRFVTRVPPQPYLRFDTNDYSLDPRLVGRRVEVRVAQREITAVALDTGELACRHRRSFAKRPHLHRPRPPARARATCAASAVVGARARGRAAPAGPLRRADPGMTQDLRARPPLPGAEGAGGGQGAAEARRAGPRGGVVLRALRRGAALHRGRLARVPRRRDADQGGALPGPQDARGVRLHLPALGQEAGGRAPRPARLPARARENVVLLGPPGTGKTHLAIALGDPRLPGRPAGGRSRPRPSGWRASARPSARAASRPSCAGSAACR